jgi:hypothetical protein
VESPVALGSATLQQRVVVRLPKPMDLALFGLVPLFVLANDLYFSFVSTTRHRLWDFFTFRTAGRAVLDGRSPYPAHATTAVLGAAKSFVYPPIAAYAFAPLSALPARVSEVLFVLGLIACLAGTLRLLGVRDWRCYTLPLLWLPVYSSLSLGTISPVLALLLACGWRYRDERPRLSAAAIGLAIIAKLFLLPIVVWLLATRRWRNASWTAIFAAAAFLIPFAAVGWHALARYPHLLRVLDAALATDSFSTRTLMHDLSIGSTTVTLLVGLCVFGLVVGAFQIGSRGGDIAPLALSIAGALVLSPIVWTHYYVLLLVPLAILRPRLSPLWFVPLVFWIEPNIQHFGSAWRLAVELAAGLAICLFATRPDFSADEVSRAGGVPPAPAS